MHRALILLLFCCVASVTALAYANPPDPIWIPGVYDAADEDDAVEGITGAAWVAAVDLGHLAPRLVLEISAVHLVIPLRPLLDGWGVAHDRAPPEIA